MQDLIFQWRQPLLSKLKQAMNTDAAHDLAHIERVTHTALRLGEAEQANLEVIYPAALLHDCVHVDKKSPLRAKASNMSANQAVRWLQEINFPNTHLEAIHHAIEAHSYSANIKPQTIEAQIVQDADRLDA